MASRKRLKPLAPSHPRDERITKIDEAYVVLTEDGEPYARGSFKRVTNCIDSLKTEKFSPSVAHGSCKKLKKLWWEWIEKVKEDRSIANDVKRSKHFEEKNLVHFDLRLVRRFEQWIHSEQAKLEDKTERSNAMYEFFGTELLKLIPWLPHVPYSRFDAKHVVAGWNKQRTAGTDLHAYCEAVLNGEDVECPDVPEYKLMEQFFDKNDHIQWYRSEWRVFCDKAMVAGALDACSEISPGVLHIWDFKRVHHFDEDPLKDRDLRYAKKLKPPFEHLRSSHRTMYSLQLSIYALIIENNYGMRVDRLSLIVVYPDMHEPLIIDLPYMKEEAHMILYNTKP